MAKKDFNAGHYAFLAGIIIAILVSFLNLTVVGISWVAVVTIMVSLGVVVGFMNITAKEVGVFLIATIALILASASIAVEINILPVVGQYLSRLLRVIIMFVAPAAIIVSLRAIYTLAEKK